MAIKRTLIFFLLSFSVVIMNGQAVDANLTKEYPFKIGNVGFAIDSMEFFVGEVYRGNKLEYELRYVNFGKKPINFKSGKFGRFVEIIHTKPTLQPKQTGTALIKAEFVQEMPLGLAHIEVSVETDDENNPYKFLYMLAEVIEDSSRYMTSSIIDTVPRMIFSHLNYDFGYLWRGKTLVHRFLFTNMGAEDLVIDNITSSDGCKVIGVPEQIVPPGGSGSVIVKVRTYGDYGVQHRTVSIASNDPRNPLIVLGVHGTVKLQTPPRQNPDFCYE